MEAIDRPRFRPIPATVRVPGEALGSTSRETTTKRKMTEDDGDDDVDDNGVDANDGRDLPDDLEYNLC